MSRYELIDEPQGRYEVIDEPKFSHTKEIGRQIGLTGRYALEGIGNSLDFLATPFRAGLNLLVPGDPFKTGGAKSVADMASLPTPKNEMERIVGEGAKLGFGSTVPLGVASKGAQTAQGATQRAFQTLAANPGQQVASATSAGLAGQSVKESGGDEVSQLGASLLAGVATPYAMSKAQSLGQSAISTVKNVTSPQNAKIAVDVKIEQALGDSLPFSAIPESVKTSIRQDVSKALRTDRNLSPNAIRRLADYRLTGAMPTAGTVTLDPAIVSQQKNLAKVGINSTDRAAQTLGQVENANNRQLIENLNTLGASRAPGSMRAGEQLLDELGGYANSQRGNINALYETAKDTGGRAAALDPAQFSRTANDLLDRNLKGAFVPENIRAMMNDFASGKTPLNVQSAEQFKTILGNAQRGAADGNVRAAIGHIREAIDNTPLISNQELGTEAISAFNSARSANRQFMTEVERNPALSSALDNAAPDKFFKRYVLDGTVRDFESLMQVAGRSPQTVMNLKAEVLGHLKSSALNGAADEVGNFSQSGFNKALRSIGDRKLQMLFSPEELTQIRAIGRVASYEQFQPKGSAVNNSNTAGAFANILERFANSPVLGRVPLGSVLQQPAQNISIGIRSNQALNVPRALVAPQPRQPAGLLMSPAAFMLPEDERRGLLSP